ncbi:hypothetical protein [Streptomyces sp. NPDC008265]|uniref:hypothetical protein n=1 Tax=Streptomyces sp. NPDC008265 TaxID=3364824 RepID=UPI0036F0079D
MGNSKAYPVHRTPDRFEAYRRARQLWALFAWHDDEVELGAEMTTVGDFRRMVAVLPDGLYDHVSMREDPETGECLWFDLDVRAAADTDIAQELPLDVYQRVPTGFEEDFVRALGRGPASICWEGRWPDEPEAGSFGVRKYDGVQVVFNSDHADWDRTADFHTVYVHVTKFGDLGRAQRLAAAIGGAVLGEAELGW